MERLGKTFLLVIEPLDFNMKESSFNCKEFGFIVGTESLMYLSNIFKFCSDYYQARSAYLKPDLLDSLKEEIKENQGTNFKKRYQKQ